MADWCPAFGRTQGRAVILPSAFDFCPSPLLPALLQPFFSMRRRTAKHTEANADTLYILYAGHALGASITGPWQVACDLLLYKMWQLQRM